MGAPDYRMTDDEVWSAIATQRAAFLDLVTGLDPDDWSRPSLCAGWRVHDVAAHLTLAQASRPRDLVLPLLRARGDFDRMMDDVTRRSAARSREEILDDLRRGVGSRHLAPGTSPRVALVDALVHALDVAVPLGVDHPVPPLPGREAAERVWCVSFPFRARRRLAGFRLVATDASWHRGTGPPVTGQVGALLLLLTGRPAALARLHGGGADLLSGARAARTEEAP